MLKSKKKIMTMDNDWLRSVSSQFHVDANNCQPLGARRTWLKVIDMCSCILSGLPRPGIGSIVGSLCVVTPGSKI